VITAAQAEQRGSITARTWVYRSITAPINVFDFTVSSHRDGPDLFLDGFACSLMADCYSGYEAVRTKSDWKFICAACVAHARRKVFDSPGQPSGACGHALGHVPCNQRHREPGKDAPCGGAAAPL
jgi:hypothetical protein